MRVYERESDYRGKGAVLALGMFDGVHIGHQKLLRTAVSIAKRRDTESLVLTFAGHPMQILFPDRAPAPLMTLSEKIKRIEALGVDALIARPFTRAFAEIDAGDYLHGLARKFRPSAIVVGYNYSFGRDGAGTPDTIRNMEGVYGYQTVVVAPITYKGIPVSSTAIRNFLRKGETDIARAMLG